MSRINQTQNKWTDEKEPLLEPDEPPAKRPRISSRTRIREAWNTLPQLSRPKKRKISAEDAPQWIWDQDQCRQWIFAVLTKYLKFPVEDAKFQSETFYGCGANIYLLDIYEWGQLVDIPSNYNTHGAWTGYAKSFSGIIESRKNCPELCHRALTSKKVS